MRFNWLNKIYILFTLFIIILILNKECFSQNSKTYISGNIVVNTSDNIDPNNFYNDIIEKIIFDEINRILTSRGFEPKKLDTLLQKVSNDQATYMASIYDDELIQDNKKKETTLDRIVFYGGAANGSELVAKESIRKGKIPYTYGKVGKDLVFKWFSNSKKTALIEDLSNNLIGISVKLDKNKRKVFVSVVFGNFKSYNLGSKYKETLSVPYTTKTYGLEKLNLSYCNRINKKENIIDLHNNLKVEGRAIYFETENVRNIKRIIKKKKDGLAVDILQEDQFTCGSPNIIDYNLLNSGYLTKRIYTSKFFKNNLADTDKNKRAFKTQLAVLPDGIDSSYELNLVIIQNKSVCRSIPQSFTITPSGKYTKKIELLADTVTVNSRFNYKPVADSMNLSFRIPFENKKASYKTKDIEPFLRLLNEPAFIIYGLNITAFSSIEGTNSENRILQQKRAQSIVKALEGRQTNIIDTDLITDFNWDDFKKDVLNTKHNILASMSMEEAQAYIREYQLNKELEPILKNHRYALIKMKVTYDISGKNEKPYVIKKFNNALAEGDKPLALSIQKFVMKQIINNKYTANTINDLVIPFKPDYAGMHMNSLWLNYHTNQISSEDFASEVEKIHNLDPTNEYIAFNNLFNKIIGQRINEVDQVSNLQTQVNRLYYTPLKKETVDGLNIKLQFKLINYADSVPAMAKVKEEAIDRIKQIINIQDESLENTLKLAELFIENNDYTFALKTLEPWIAKSIHNEPLVFTYVSLCSRYEARMHTQKFNNAMKIAQEINPTRFCELFNGDFFSLKVFENNYIKEEYCKHCSTNENMAFDQ